LTWYVHQDFTYQAYLNACQILLHSGNVGLSRSNPYSSFNKESAFVTFGAANILEWIGSIASAALRAAWCQKWLIHRRLRPEEFGGRVYQRIANSKSYPIHAELLNSAAIDRILTHTGNALLPIAYPEGSPTHPSYPAGHAAVAGACVTALKAFFDESAIVEGPVIVSDNGDQLHPYTGAPLTVGDELNKLASNMSIARNAAGVHYRSDGTQGLLLGENVAIEMLRDIATTYSENFPGFTFRRFDGTQLTIPA
jgi:membrane-associated phospholipid phosphatase